MKMLRSAAIALAVLAIAGNGPARAGSAVAEKNYERIQQAWEKARAAGGYGIPYVAVPEAVVAAFVGAEPEADGRLAEKKTG